MGILNNVSLFIVVISVGFLYRRFIDKIEIDSHKTKGLHSKLTKFNFNSALFVYGDDNVNDNFKKASSNIPRVSLLSCLGINVKDLISHEKIFIEEKSIDKISERLL